VGAAGGAARDTGRPASSRAARVALLVPDQPEHHYRYDPGKQLSYTVTTLAWIGDPAAEGYARDVLARLESGRDGGLRPRRTATARLDLALALVGVGNLDEAAGQALLALRSGRIVPSSAWRAAEILGAVEAAGLSDAADLREAYETVTGGANDGSAP
jgi:hypothetical protein